MNESFGDLRLRRGTPQDATACGTICYHAFKTIAEAHNFTPDIPSVEVGIGLLDSLLSHPGFYSIVAELDGKAVGSNFLDERGTIAGLGPITVDPTVQNRRIGRQLMEKAHERAVEKKFGGVRLVQAGYHTRSLSLYARLGYETREPLACMQGPASNLTVADCAVRIAVDSDIEACNRVCQKVHGHNRGGELTDAVRAGTATVVEREGRVTGYATVIGFFGHAVGETSRDLKALIGAAKEFAGPGFLLPIRNGEVFRWCLEQGLRVTQPMTLMSKGSYNEPGGAFLPSILY
ncbi:MAG TPA: GNAT family N-acetyltransferase [Chthoniobacterales bacterium]|jgi:GNAT superfamily N-acetyltransferase